MGEKNFYFKYFLPRLEFWALLCGLFGFFFILSRANFESPDIEKIFIFIWFFYLFSGIFFGFFFNGGASFLKIKMEHRDSWLINTYILDKHVDSKIPDERLKEMLYILKKEPFIVFKKTIFYSGIAVFLTALTMYWVGTLLFNIGIILIGGLISVAILGLFSIFSTEISFVNNLLRESRQMLKERKIEIKEKIQLATLRNRFNYFIALLFLVVITFFNFIAQPSPFILILLTLAFIMIVIISRMLFSSIYSVFQEIKDFAEKIPHKEKTEYFTGSSYQEVLDLSKDLNESAKRIYESAEKERKMREELQEKVNELNKWFRVTVGRELKMVELKKEIERLEQEKK